MQEVLKVRGLRKVYGKKENTFEALKGVDLDIKRGESVAIVGKSGSGKSTLMHLIALLDAPTTGNIEINGRDAHSLKKKHLNLLRNKTFGFVFQQFFMNANDSVLNNVILPLKIGKISGKERKRLAYEALKAVELTEKAKNKANDLSGGQKQRVCIARAIVNNPDIIFADEPTGNLDSETSELIENLLFGLHKGKGITLIIVTHDHDLAAKCDRQILIKDGLVVNHEKLNVTAMPTSPPAPSITTAAPTPPPPVTPPTPPTTVTPESSYVSVPMPIPPLPPVPRVPRISKVQTTIQGGVSHEN